MTPRAAARARPPGGASALLRWLTPTVWSGVVLAAGATLVSSYFLVRGDAGAAVRAADREIAAALAPGERVLARVPVFRQYWWDFFRITYGVLAATDRRLVYIGLPPAPLLRRDDGPIELDEAEFAFATLPVAGPRPLAFGRRPGVRLASGGREEVLAYSARDSADMSRTLDVMRLALERRRQAADAERRATEAAQAASQRAIYHLVQRGEALEFIGRRYGVSVDSLLALNGLASPRITTGQRLLVRGEAR